MKLPLDKQTVVWWFLGDERVGAGARLAIRDAGDVYVSAASAWELSTKARLGKWPDADALARDLATWVARQGMRPLAVTLEHGARAGQLPGPRRDPFDRMLIAQCQAEGLSIASADAIFDRYGVRRIWS